MVTFIAPYCGLCALALEIPNPPNLPCNDLGPLNVFAVHEGNSIHPVSFPKGNAITKLF